MTCKLVTFMTHYAFKQVLYLKSFGKTKDKKLHYTPNNATTHVLLLL